MRTYIQRFRRSIRNLQSLGVDITMSYDSEALGSRLLDRSGLGQPEQRMILVGTQQRLDLEVTAEALVLKYPDFRPAPAIPQAKGKGKSPPSTSTSSYQSSMARSSGEGSSGKGPSTTTSRVMVVDNPDALDQVPEEEAEDFSDHDQEPDADDDQDQEEDPDAEDDENDSGLDLEGLSHVLTVTAKKLAGITLGRKYTTKQKSNMSKDDWAREKQISHCGACGEKGHWKGDAECPKTASKGSSYRNNKGSSKGDRSDQRGKGPSQQQKPRAFTVVHHEHGSVAISDDPNYGNLFQCNMVRTPQEFQVHEVHAFSVDQFVGKLIVDSGCQRNCCGPDWHEQHARMLREHGLQVHKVPCNDVFQFGKGEPLTAKFRSYIPTGMAYDKCFLLGVAVVDADVPLLGSHQLLDELGAIIDVPRKMIYLQTLDVSLPLVKIAGHLTVCIDQFPKDINKQTKLLSHEQFWHDPNPNCLLTPATVAHSTSLRDQRQFDQAHVLSAANMADSMEALCPDPEQLQEEGLHLHGKSGNSGNHAQALAAGCSPTDDGKPRSRVPPLRQCNRALRPMPAMQSQVEVGQQSARLARFPWIAKLLCTVATIATAVLDSNGAQVQAEGPAFSFNEDLSPRHGGTADDWTTLSAGATHDLSAQHGSFGCCNGAQPRGSATGSRGHHPKHGLQPDGTPARSAKVGSTGHGGSTASSSQHQTSGAPRGRRELRLGSNRRLQHTLKKAAENYEAESNIYHSLASVSDRPPPMIDIFELFSGSSKFTKMAQRYGLNALQPFDIKHGPHQDLKDAQVQADVKKALHKFKPWFVIMGLDCRLWNIFNANLNYSHRLELLQELRDEELPLVEFAWEVALIQMKHGRYFLMENPQRSRLWDLSCTTDLESMPGTWKTTLDAGAFWSDSPSTTSGQTNDFHGQHPRYGQHHPQGAHQWRAFTLHSNSG